jgi:hypothetical protein
MLTPGDFFSAKFESFVSDLDLDIGVGLNYSTRHG